MEGQLAMLQESQTDSCLPGQTDTAQDPQTRWRCKGMGAPPPIRLRQPTPELTEHPSGTPLVSPGAHKGAQASDIEGVPPGYVIIPTPLSSAEHFNQD